MLNILFTNKESNKMSGLWSRSPAVAALKVLSKDSWSSQHRFVVAALTREHLATTTWPSE